MNTTSKHHNKKTVYLGLSGGVDSAVSAYLLKQAGYDVHCVFIQTWSPDWMECSWRDDRRDAMRVAIHLDLPFYDLDLRDEYKQGVADYMISEYAQGRTPNPDVMCNRMVKFGGFMRWALARGADYVATGHYARISAYDCDALHSRGFAQNTEKHATQRLFSPTTTSLSGFDKFFCWLRRSFSHILCKTYCNISLVNKKDAKVSLKKGIDPAKDQSYFLWTLESSELAQILFPIGNLQKSETRRIAQEAGLPVAAKKDSQGVCFLGDIDMKEFLSHYIESKPGNVLDHDGNVIGTHDGAVFVTLGQRGGFSLHHTDPHQTPLYVIAKDIEANTITVASRSTSTDIERGSGKTTQTLTLSQVVEREVITTACTAQIRYHGEFLSIQDVRQGGDDQMVVTLDTLEPIAVGQSCVFYDGDVCVGGGVVDGVE